MFFLHLSTSLNIIIMVSRVTASGWWPNFGLECVTGIHRKQTSWVTSMWMIRSLVPDHRFVYQDRLSLDIPGVTSSTTWSWDGRSETRWCTSQGQSATVARLFSQVWSLDSEKQDSLGEKGCKNRIDSWGKGHGKCVWHFRDSLYYHWNDFYHSDRDVLLYRVSNDLLHPHFIFHMFSRKSSHPSFAK